MYEELTMPRLLKQLEQVSAIFPDPRTGGPNIQYEVTDAALGAFAVFFTQSPSFLAHQTAMQKAKGMPRLHRPRAGAKTSGGRAEAEGNLRPRLVHQGQRQVRQGPAPGKGPGETVREGVVQPVVERLATGGRWRKQLGLLAGLAGLVNFFVRYHHGIIMLSTSEVLRSTSSMQASTPSHWHWPVQEES